MLRFKNKDSLPATPKSWTAPNGHKIPYDSVRQTWEAFVERVMQYCDANSIQRPALDVLEDHICHQVSGWACIGEKEHRARLAPSKSHLLDTPKKCGACGK